MKSAGLLESALAWTLLLTVIATAAGLECHDQESTNHTIKCSDHQKTCARSYFSDGKFMGASCGDCTKFHFAALSVGLTAFCKTCSDDKCNSAKLTNGLSFSPQFSCSVGSNLIVLCNTGVSVCFRAKYSNGRTMSGCGECAGIMAEALKEKKAVACKTCSTAKCNTEVLLTVEAPTPKTECQPSAAVDPKIPAKCVYFQNEHSDEKTIIATCGDCVSFSKYADKALISTTCQSCTADTCAAEPSMAKVEPAAKGLKCFVSFDQKSKIKTLAMCKAGVRQCHRAESKSGRNFLHSGCGDCSEASEETKSLGRFARVECKSCNTNGCNTPSLTFDKYEEARKCYEGEDKSYTILCKFSVWTCMRSYFSDGTFMSAGCGSCDKLHAEAKALGKTAICRTCSTNECNSASLMAGVEFREFFRCHVANFGRRSFTSVCNHGVTTCYEAELTDGERMANCGTCAEVNKNKKTAKICKTCNTPLCNVGLLKPSQDFECYVSFNNSVNVVEKCPPGVKSCFRAKSTDGAVFIAACGNCEPFNSHIKGAAEGVTCKACGTERCNSAQPPEKAATEGIECNINFGTGASTTVKCGATVRSCFRAELKDGKEFASCGDCNGPTALFGRIGNLVRCDACFTDRCGSMQAVKLASRLACYTYASKTLRTEMGCSPGQTSCFLAEFSSGSVSGGCGDCSRSKTFANGMRQSVNCSTCTTDKCNTFSSTSGAAAAGPAPVLTCYAHSNTAAKIEQSCPGFNKCYLAIYGSGAESGNCGDCSLIESAAKLTGQTVKCSTCSTDKCNAGSSTGAIGAGVSGPGSASALTCYLFDYKSNGQPTEQKCFTGRECMTVFHDKKAMSGACGDCSIINSAVKKMAVNSITCTTCSKDKCNSGWSNSGAGVSASAPGFKCYVFNNGSGKMTVKCSSPLSCLLSKYNNGNGNIFEGRCGDCAAINAMGKITGVKVECHSCKTDLCNSVEEFKRISSAKSDEQSSASSVQYGNIEAIGINVFLTVAVFAYA
ncbi:hypothetical protein BOX15_Mlig019351g1 [Macrostomum lignano]|uniref:Variant-specific surface protein n=1 Tax=Macrostomum lignano TaxID=282301 RepID=A0A267EX07_9PLAT|nr:hypothetical protein BOX15_Mlig019351g1 [Macrostomum lignano]